MAQETGKSFQNLFANKIEELLTKNHNIEKQYHSKEQIRLFS